MLLIDDLLLMPAQGLMFVFKEVYKGALQDAINEGENIQKKLTELYRALETGQITSEEFDAREKELLDRLDEIESKGTLPEADSQEKER